MKSFVSLDQLDDIENFHLQFMIQLSRHLGFGVHETREVLSGSFSAEDDLALKTLLDSGYEQACELPYSRRKHLLEQLLLFYYRHIEGMTEVRSVDVLAEVLR